MNETGEKKKRISLKRRLTCVFQSVLDREREPTPEAEAECVLVEAGDKKQVTNQIQPFLPLKLNRIMRPRNPSDSVHRTS